MPKKPKRQRSHSYLPRNVHLRHFTGNNIPMHRHLPYELTFVCNQPDSADSTHRHLTSCKLIWNGSVYNIKNTLIIQFLNEIYRLLTKSFRFLPLRIRKNSCSYRPAESQRAHACHSDRKTQMSGEQNNRLGDSMNEKLLLLIPRLSVEYKGQKRAYQQCRMKMFTVPLSRCAKAMKSYADSLKTGHESVSPVPAPAVPGGMADSRQTANTAK